MTFRRIARLIGAAILTASAILLSAPIPSASAEPCPDVEVVFARGTSEPPGVGGVGQAFVDALRVASRRKSVDVYPVNYPASSDFGSRDPVRRNGHRGDQGRGGPRPGHGGELPQHQDRARRILAGRRRGGIRHLGCRT